MRILRTPRGFLRARALLAVVALAFPSLAAGTSKILDVPLVAQEHDQWCWAGSTRAALVHYGFDVAQCSIAEYTRSATNAGDMDLGKTPCCADWNQGCNHWNYFWFYGGSIADILLHFGSLQNVTHDSPLSLAESSASIDQGRLIIIRWEWSGGGGHFIVAHGYDGGSLYYMNPWPGEGLKVADRSWVVSGDNHTWTASLTTGPTSSCADKADGTHCDDGDPCTSTDVCTTGGVCKGTPVDCGETACHTAGHCNPANGTCDGTAKPEGTLCDDGDPCTVSKVCAAGICQGGKKKCSGPDECQIGRCDAKTGECSAIPLDEGAACTNGSCHAGKCTSGCSTGGSGLSPLAALALLALKRRRRASPKQASRGVRGAFFACPPKPAKLRKP